MKKWLFLMSGILEIAGSLIIYFNPSAIFGNLSPNSIESKLYAITMSCFGIIGILCFRHYRPSDLFRHLFLVHLFFHAAVTVMTYSTPEEAFAFAIPASITHGILFVLFVMGYLKDIQPDPK